MRMSSKLTHKELLSNWVVPFLLFGVGFLWKLFFISHRDVCLDEPFTIFHAQQSIGHILALSAEGEPNPPLFMLLLHFWIKLFGIGTIAVRLLPLIFSSLTVIFIYFTGKRFFGVYAGLIASGMFLFSNFQFFHGLEVRTYSLLSLAAASSLYFYLCVLKEPGNVKTLIALILSNLVMVYSHYFGWFVIFIQFISGFLYLKDKRVVKSLLIAQGVSFLAYLPFFFILIRQFLKSSQGTWIEPPGSGTDYFYQLNLLLNHKEVFNGLAWIFAAGVGFMIYKKSWRTLPKELLILFVWWFVPFTIMFLVSFKIPVFITRYLLFNAIGMYLFVAAAIVCLFNRHKILVPVAGLVVIALTVNRMRILPDYFANREVENAVRFVQTHQHPENTVFIYPYWDNVGFAYYFDRSIFQDAAHFDRRLARQQIYPVWGWGKVKSIVEETSPRKIVYYLNGPAPGDDDGIYQYLTRHYAMADSVFYPQTLNVFVFEKK